MLLATFGSYAMSIKSVIAAALIAAAPLAAAAATLTSGASHDLFDASGSQIGWNYNEAFGNGASAGSYTFTLYNNLPSSDTLVLSVNTVLQFGDLALFNDGVVISFGDETQTIAQGDVAHGTLSAVVAAGETVDLTVTFGDVTTQYGLVSDIDISVVAEAPIPAGAVLLLTALGGVAATRKRKAA